jgi:hypothetical protein
MSWGIGNLTRDLKKLKTLYNKETDLNKKYELSTYIYSLEEIISNFTFDNKTKIINQGNYFKTLSSLPNYRVYLPYVYDFICKLDSYKIDEEEIVRVNNSDYTEKDMYDLSREFYKQVGGKFFTAYKEFDKEKKNRINFCNFDSVDSTTYYIPGINSFYINLGALNDDRDFIEAFIHEAGHIISAKINNKRYNSNNIFTEIESLFFEILADDFLYKETGDIYFKDMEKDKVDKYYYEGNIIDIMYNAYETIIDNAKDIDDPNKLFDDICNDEGLIKAEEVNVDIVMKYVFSYICALELVEIYKQDKEKALHLLDNIISDNRNITEYEKIVKSINPCEHLDGYIKRLKKEK